MFTTKNGWTKAKMKKQIRLKNNGDQATIGTRCLYRTKSGNACAAGCFIPDKQFKLEMNEAGRVCDVIQPNILDKIIFKINPVFKDIKFPLSNRGMLKLQDVHDFDYNDYTEDMRERLCTWIDKNVKDAK